MLRNIYQQGFETALDYFRVKEAARKLVTPKGLAPAPPKPPAPAPAAVAAANQAVNNPAPNAEMPPTGFIGKQIAHAKDFGSNLSQLAGSFGGASPIANRMARQQAFSGLGRAATGLLPSAGLAIGGGLLAHHFLGQSDEEKQQEARRRMMGIG